MTLASNSENFYFSPNSVLNFRKSYQIWGNCLKNRNVTGKKQTGGVENTPPPSVVLIGFSREIARKTLSVKKNFKGNIHLSQSSRLNLDKFGIGNEIPDCQSRILTPFV